MLIFRILVRLTQWLTTATILTLLAATGDTLLHYFNHLFPLSKNRQTAVADTIPTTHGGLAQLARDRDLLPPLVHNLHINRVTVGDLIKVVSSSTFDGGDRLVEMLVDIRKAGDEIADDLQVYSSSINGVIDQTRSYTNTLNAALQELSSASLIQEFGCRAMPSIALLPHSCAPFREAPLIFREFLDRSETRVVKLIEQGNDLNGKLMRFGERLTAMAAFAAGEMRTLHGEENTVKNAIWTWLGGNRGLLEEHQRNIVSLERVFDHHSLADRCVSATQKSLKEVLTSFQELRPLTSNSKARASGLEMRAVIQQIGFGMKRIGEKQGVHGMVGGPSEGGKKGDQMA